MCGVNGCLRLLRCVLVFLRVSICMWLCIYAPVCLLMFSLIKEKEIENMPRNNQIRKNSTYLYAPIPEYIVHIVWMLILEGDKSPPKLCRVLESSYMWKKERRSVCVQKMGKRKERQIEKIVRSEKRERETERGNVFLDR